MTRLQVDVLSDATNKAVLRLPSREFPGVLIQGDTLKQLHRLSHALQQGLSLKDEDDELRATAEDLHRRLSNFVAHYEVVLMDNGVPLPYPPDEPAAT